ncbi:hypothetical protein V5F77_09120 [Xanthobacter sp. DSM 24535]|uniref:hypothetical protein n=1 Tax=Roseixanthobacter psychrophilus TaxID=3119917 RepID=UPI00372BF699
MSSVNVEPGLYVLRYASAGNTRLPPLVEVACDARAQQVVTLIGDPRSASGVLVAPGAALVIRSVGSASVQIKVRAMEPGGSLDARVTLEGVSRVTAGGPVAPGAAVIQNETDGASIQILGHLARRGDVRVGAGEWLGGPAAPLPIEGVAVVGAPSALGLEYQVLSGGRNVQWSPWATAGSFAGSRGRATPLLGIRLRVRGGESQVRAEALFLGSPIVSRTGQDIELVGLSDRDPMVGLCLALSRAEAKIAAGASSVTREAAAKVRVFRAGSV